MIISPKGGKSPLEPRALKWPLVDPSAKSWLNNPRRIALLEGTKRPAEIDPTQIDAIYFTGGHAVMWDFPDDADLQALARSIWEQGGVVSSVCHGYCGLLNVTLSDGRRLVSGKRVTGFAWWEEVVAGVASKVPYNAEAEMKNRGAHYRKALLPFLPHTEVDGRLITGQNPFSAKLTARKIVNALESKPSGP